MVEVKIDYLGDLRCKAVHGPSGQSIITDAPVDNKGKGEYFSPTDLVAASLGTCMLTIMGIAANGHKIDMAGTTCKVMKEMASSPSRMIGKLTVAINVPTKLTDDQKKILEHAAMHCPVHKSIHAEVQMDVKFNWGA